MLIGGFARLDAQWFGMHLLHRPHRQDQVGRPPPSRRLLRAWDNSLRQAFAIARDFARRRDPQPVAVLDDVTDGVAKGAQAKWLADNEGVHRDGKDERVFA